MFIVTNEYKNLTDVFKHSPKEVTPPPTLHEIQNNNLDREADKFAHKISTQQLVLKSSNTFLSTGPLN